MLERDIQSGTCLVKYLVCLVIDEAHRASGNYSYCVAIRELMAVPVQLRILALSATPGSKQQDIQQIIDNLHVSTLEYRNESDHDVSPFVYNRQIELIEVARGKDAVEVNDMLLEVIRPYAARLTAIGVLQNRDFKTLSPCDLLSSRDKFRLAPPEELPQVKYGEVEGCFGVLITTYHIRKLLSGHGIRPAYEMLQEKLKQGYFAKLMSKNEVIQRAQLLMQRSLSHGAPSPKLSKMLEILTNHFKSNDPQNSRVIIFSNFRGSVRDIIDALATIGESVKAAQFIGQSSGKTLKGQSQKVQQAVLEKFRAGKYNVLVATSIGEEGLDIMEVDLVICFDANVSPLRMIQRMGRTGRKHDGRVVVLACEGTELKGYKYKQANNKAAMKHMRSGGMNSFNFHPSPRMIPHVYKPEVQFVEMSIEQYVPRGRHAKDLQPIQTHTFKEKLTDLETELLSKYFHPKRKNFWRPSLIAFPHFQAFPSRECNVLHSFRSGMLIDAMQRLNVLSIAQDAKKFVLKDEASASGCSDVENVCQYGNNREDFSSVNSSLKVSFQSDKVSLSRPSENKNPTVSNIESEDASVHSYLFGSEFVSVDALGKVAILSVPVLPSKEASHPGYGCALHTELVNNRKPDRLNFRTSPAACKEPRRQTDGVAELCSSSHALSINNATAETSISRSFVTAKENMMDIAEQIPQTPILDQSLLNKKHYETLMDDVGNGEPRLADRCCNNFNDSELSPRLTNLIKSGVVPESPIDDGGLDDNRRNEIFVPDIVSPVKLHTEIPMETPNSKDTQVNNGSERVVLGCNSNKIHIPLHKANNGGDSRDYVSTFPVVDDVQVPLSKLSDDNCSRDCQLSWGEKSRSVEQVRMFKRLYKHGDSGKQNILESLKENLFDPRTKSERSPAHARVTAATKKHTKGERKAPDCVRTFIEEEAEVSSEADASNDEEDDEDNDVYDDSFLDDRIKLTAANTPAGASTVDMMAIYRRSLLSQSPVVRKFKKEDISPDSMVPIDSRSTPEETGSSLQTPQVEVGNQPAILNSVSCQMNPCSEKVSPSENKTSGESRKRKLGFFQVASVPSFNLEEVTFQLDTAANTCSLQGQAESHENGDMFDDDQFYEGLDLDEVEAQATMLLKSKTEFALQKQGVVETDSQNFGLVGSPSFDLGF